MKKAYVKVKPKNVKKSYGKVYIIASVFSALLCAFVFSFVLRANNDIEKDIKIDLTDIKPEEIAQVSEPIEIEVPITPEVKETPKVEISEPEPKTAETGVFNAPDIKISMPINGEIINDYSGTKPIKSKTMGDWRTHNGIDIKASTGTPIKTPAEGKVILSEDNKLTGKTISIDHGNGLVSTLYGLESINVKTGDKVSVDTIVGISGNSALLESAEEPHVHFELRKDGKLENPNDYIK